MEDILQNLVVLILYSIVILIVLFASYLIYINKRIISKEINRNKLIYILLILVFLTGTFLRVGFVSTLLHPDQGFYTDEAQQIVNNNKFSYSDRDSPAFPVLISIVMRLISREILSSHINAIFGSLSIIIIFVMVRLLFKNNLAALLSSILLTFNPIHLEYSVKGLPHISSIFFCMLSVIFIIVSIKKRFYSLYIITGLIIGFTAQMYFIEIVLILPVLIYLILKKGIKKNIIIKSIFLILAMLISILPFIFLQNISYNQREINTENIIDKALCIWVPARCERVVNNKEPEVIVNHINNPLVSYFGFVYVGIGSKGTYDTDFFYDGWHYFPFRNKNRVNDNINLVYLLSTLLIIIGLIKVNIYWKEWQFVFLISIVFQITLSFYYDLPKFNLLYSLVFIIPLIAFGLIKSLDILKYYIQNKQISKMIILIVLVGLISPFFTEGMIEKLKTAKGNNLEVFWDITHKVIYTKDKSKCSLIPTKRLRYECTQWIDINNIIFNQSKCSALEDKYFEENCLNRNITFYKLKDSIKNNNIPKEEENLRGKESLCYDRDLLALYCDKLIPSISDIFSKDNLIKNKKCNEFNKNLEKNCLNVIEMSKEFERRYNRPLNCLQLRNYCYYIDLFDLKKHLV